MPNSEDGSPTRSERAHRSVWAWWNNDARWRARVDEKLAEMSLGIPPDRGGISVHNGFGWRELLVIGLLLLGGVGGTAYMAQSQISKPDTPSAASPVDSEYEVRFYDANGNPIDVPHVTERVE